MADAYKTNGAFSWSELTTSDPEAAKRFYGELFGWEMEDMSIPEMAYTVVKTGGESVGGIMAIPPEAISDWEKRILGPFFITLLKFFFCQCLCGLGKKPIIYIFG